MGNEEVTVFADRMAKDGFDVIQAGEYVLVSNVVDHAVFYEAVRWNSGSFDYEITMEGPHKYEVHIE
jgi:hypothetical protein